MSIKRMDKRCWWCVKANPRNTGLRVSGWWLKLPGMRTFRPACSMHINDAFPKTGWTLQRRKD